MSNEAGCSHRSLPQFRRHGRNWRENRYVYPVLSRRSGGLSIGINLNPDKACNFDCVYCQVDRTTPPRVREVDPDVLRAELAEMLEAARSGAIFAEPEFSSVPAALRRVCDIAFSGDGEPTTCKHFKECVQIAAELKRRFALDGVKIVLITDACYLTRPEVEEALRILDAHEGEIWAKLDAGTEAYYRRVNRPNVPLAHVIENITAAARVRPVVIQALFMRLDEQPPPDREIEAFAGRLREIVRAGGSIRMVQVYTVARPPAESFVTPLTDAEVDRIVRIVEQRTRLPVEGFYAPTRGDGPA